MALSRSWAPRPRRLLGMGITQRVRQRRAGDPLVPFRQSCRISMPRWRERRRRHRVPRALRVWLQRRAGDPLVPFRQSCRISMPRWREPPPPQGDRAAHRVIMQRIDAFKAAIGCVEIIGKDPPWHQRILRHSESARMVLSRSWAPRPRRLLGMGITQRVRQRRAGDPLVPFRQSCLYCKIGRADPPPPQECTMQDLASADAQEILWATIMQNLSAKMAECRLPQGDHAAHIDAFKAVIGCIEIIAKDPPWHQRILRHSESAR